MIANLTGRSHGRIAHPHTPRTSGAALMGKEEMIQGLVEAVDRTFAAGTTPEALRWTADLFRQLDDTTLRALAYRQGVFEEEPQEDEGLRRAVEIEE